MLRNSTEKYKKIYGTVSTQIPKQALTLRMPSGSKQFEKITSQMSLLKQMNQHTLSKKIQTLNGYKHYRTLTNYHVQASKSDLDGISNLRKNSFYSYQMSAQKPQRTRSGLSNYNKESSTNLEVLSRDSKYFIENLPKNSLFYCTYCCQYVFDIEKKRHYPQCKDEWNAPTKIPQDYAVWAYQKLAIIVQLAQYTSTKQDSIK